MMKFAVSYHAPIAVRYPRGSAYDGLKAFRAPMEFGRAEWIYREWEIALFAVGSMVRTAENVREQLKKKGYGVSLVNARFVKPIDEEAVREACRDHVLIITMEENVSCGGYGEKVLDCMNRSGLANHYLNISIPDAYVEHGDVEALKREVGIDADSITERILKTLEAGV